MDYIGITVADKSKQFAVRIIKFSRFLNEEKREYIIAKQVFRSGTSIGANIRESKNAQSDVDFIHKFNSDFTMLFCAIKEFLCKENGGCKIILLNPGMEKKSA